MKQTNHSIVESLDARIARAGEWPEAEKAIAFACGVIFGFLIGFGF